MADTNLSDSSDDYTELRVCVSVDSDENEEISRREPPKPPERKLVTDIQPPKPPERKFVTDVQPPPRPRRRVPPPRPKSNPPAIPTQIDLTKSSDSVTVSNPSVTDYVTTDHVSSPSSKGDVTDYVSHDNVTPRVTEPAGVTDVASSDQVSPSVTPSSPIDECASQDNIPHHTDDPHSAVFKRGIFSETRTVIRKGAIKSRQATILGAAYGTQCYKSAPNIQSVQGVGVSPPPVSTSNDDGNYSVTNTDQGPAVMTEESRVPRFNTSFVRELNKRLAMDLTKVAQTSSTHYDNNNEIRGNIPGNEDNVDERSVVYGSCGHDQDYAEIPEFKQWDGKFEEKPDPSDFDDECPVYRSWGQNQEYAEIAEKPDHSDFDDECPVYQSWGQNQEYAEIPEFKQWDGKFEKKADHLEKTEQENFPEYQDWNPPEPEYQDWNPPEPEYQDWNPPEPEYLELEPEYSYDKRTREYDEANEPREDYREDVIYMDPADMDSDHSTEYEVSWGSSEFDSYSDDEGEASNVKEHGQKVLNKLKHWQNKRKGSVRDDEEVTFIEVKINDNKYPPPQLPPEPDGLSDNQRLRRQIVQCILDSENSYVTSLQRVVWEYEYPLSDSSPPLISENKCNIIFYKVKHLLQVHYQFRIGLSDIVATWDEKELIGQTFTASFSKAMVVDVYSDFVNNFSLATELIKHCARTKPVFAEFLKVRQSSSDKLSLFGLLVKPIQRFPQFILLLQDLLKHTSTEHDDRFNLQVALTELDNLAHKLNDRKRVSAQILGANQLFKNMDVRHVCRQTEGAPLLLRQDDITETHCSGQSQTPKWKPLRLSMLSDTLLCTHTLIKAGKSGSDEKHRLKWSVPLASVTIKDSVITPDTNVLLKGQPGQIIITSTRPVRGEESALYGELDGLIHDFTVITQITSLVSSLKRSYQELSEDSLQSLTRSIQLRIQTLDEHLRTIDSSSLQLLIKSKQGKRHVIVDFKSADVKRRWLQDLRLQQIASLPSNNPAWLNCPPTLSKQHPNYIVKLSLNITNEMNQVVCGTVFNLVTDWKSGVSKNYLWLCGYNQNNQSTSDSGGGTTVAIATVDAESRPHVVESFKLCNSKVGSCVLATSVNYQRQRGLDTVWMATDVNTIIIHNLADSCRQQPLCVINLTERVTHLVCTHNRVLASTTTGIVRAFHIHQSDQWSDLSRDRYVRVSDQSVDGLCPDGDKLWCGSGRHVYQLDISSMTVTRSFKASVSADVSYLARSGVGLFVGFDYRAQLLLYHSETLTQLQDVNLASNVKKANESTSTDLSQSDELCHITCLSVIDHWLWIGTSAGCVLLLPLPRLEGVPLISSRPLVSRHSHHGPVRFLLSTSHLSVVNQQRNADNSPGPDDSAADEDATESIPSTTKYKSRSLSDLDSIDSKTESQSRIKSLYSSLFGPKSEDLDKVLENQFSASDTFAEKASVSTLPALSIKSNFDSIDSTMDKKVKIDDSLVLTVAGGEGYVDRKQGSGREECGPNIQMWCSSR